MLEQADIEGEAELLRRLADMDDREPPWELATRLLGAGAVRTVHARSLPGDAALARVHDQWRIYVRRGLDWDRASFAVAHELGEWALARSGYVEPDIEEVADRLAAAIVAPREAFLSALRRDPRLPVVSRVLAVPEPLAALREGETAGTPIALVDRRVRVRGEPWSWPETEAGIRALAKGKPPGPGIVRVRLREDPRRVLLRGVGE